MNTELPRKLMLESKARFFGIDSIESFEKLLNCPIVPEKEFFVPETVFWIFPVKKLVIRDAICMYEMHYTKDGKRKAIHFPPCVKKVRDKYGEYKVIDEEKTMQKVKEAINNSN